jgi:hypothetical protein
VLNHFRTLLVNVSANGEDIAEEKIPSNFTPARLPTCVQAVRRVLFGSSPDRAMLNYRTELDVRLGHRSAAVRG